MTEAVGFALVQFVWQGALIGAFTALVLIALGRTSAHVRYLVGCVSLVVMSAAPIVTAVRHVSENPRPLSGIASTSAPSTQSAVTATRLTNVAPSPAVDLRPAPFSAAWLRPWLPVVVLSWSAGVLILALRLLRGWMRVRQIRGNATPILTADWPEAVRLLAERLDINRRVQLAATTLSDVPAVVGWLRPVILVPAGVLAGLPPAHLDAILAHELAHVRRWDYLVNVGQSVVETLLFYHPAVWCVSRQIRIEREHCCDDLAASVCGSRAEYAHALASLEELRGEAPRLAMAATGGHLLNRVRRQLQPELSSGPTLSVGVAMGVVLTILISLAGSYVNGMSAAPNRTTASVTRLSEERPQLPAASEMPRPVLTERLQPTSITAPRLESTRASLQSVAPGIVAVGGIVGRVMDQDNGRLPGATVTVSSVVPAVVNRSAITNASGEFTFANLASNTYVLTVRLPGFGTSTTEVQVAANADSRPNITLYLGAIGETVTVEGSRVAPATPPDPVQIDMYPTTASAAFEAARLLYEREQFQEADAMTTLAIDLRRASLPAPTPVPAWDPNGPARVGGVIRAPTKVRNINPIYPAGALAAGAQTVVIIGAVIGTDGTVKDSRILRGDPQLEQAALGAVRQWLYSPTELNNRPIEVRLTATVNFRIP